MRFELPSVTAGLLKDGESVYVLRKSPGEWELCYSKGDLEAVTNLPYHGEDYETWLVGLRARCEALIDSCRAMGLREGETFVSGAKS